MSACVGIAGKSTVHLSDFFLLREEVRAGGRSGGTVTTAEKGASAGGTRAGGRGDLGKGGGGGRVWCVTAKF